MALQKEDGLQLTRRYTYLRGSREAINSPHGFADRYNIQRKLTSIKKMPVVSRQSPASYYV